MKPAVHDGVVYQPESANVKGVSAFTLDGKRVWPGPRPRLEGGDAFAPQVQGSPAVANGLVFFGANDGAVYAIEAASGDPVWVWREGGGAPISSSVAVTDGVVYVATDEGAVFAIAPVAGERIGVTTSTTVDDSGSGTTVPGGTTVPPDDDGSGGRPSEGSPF